MKHQPSKKQMQNTNDSIETPQELADAIFEYYYTGGSMLEPCCGLTKPFVNAFNKVKFRDKGFIDFNDPRIDEDYDFLDNKKCERLFCEEYDWIITNPPWSKIKEFLDMSMYYADNIVFLCTLNHLFTKARLRLIHERGYNVVDITTWDTPKSFPQSGFQLGTFHIRHNNEMPVDQFPVVHNGELRRYRK